MNKFPFNARRFSLNYQFTFILRFYFPISMLISSNVAVCVRSCRQCFCVACIACVYRSMRCKNWLLSLGHGRRRKNKQEKNHAAHTCCRNRQNCVYCLYFFLFYILGVFVFLGRRLLCICKKTS